MAVIVPPLPSAPPAGLAQSQVGRLSFSARYTSSGGSDTISNASLVALCEQGPLRKFFSTAYPGVSGDADMMNAWAAAGGFVSVQSTAATTPVVQLALDVAFKPTFVMSAAAAGEVSLRCALSYSASR